ncbi:hypothetical protein MPER_01459 [Moniliophthora perniciosa FA553]|nr:hypothetical protein MPER_01459 [Moniliophthora perniciosa FA553]
MNYFIYGLFAGNPKTYIPIPTGHGVDVRDVAKAHILALTAPGKDRRFIVCSQVFTWKDISAIIRTERPELANRVPPEDAECPVQTCAPLDDRSTKEVLGLKEYVPWEKTIVDTVDACLEYEKKQMVSTL